MNEYWVMPIKHLPRHGEFARKLKVPWKGEIGKKQRRELCGEEKGDMNENKD